MTNKQSQPVLSKKQIIAYILYFTLGLAVFVGIIALIDSKVGTDNTQTPEVEIIQETETKEAKEIKEVKAVEKAEKVEKVVVAQKQTEVAQARQVDDVVEIKKEDTPKQNTATKKGLFSKKTESDKGEKGVGTSVTSMNPVSEAGYVYSFEKITWVYNDRMMRSNTDKTKLSFDFENFTRRESKFPAVFKIPFYVGMYEGQCVEATELPTTVPAPLTDRLCEQPITVGIVSCGGSEDSTWIAVSQCGFKLIVSEKSGKTWNHVRQLDMRKIVE